MAVKKSEIYSSLWKGCDELRGGMDASQYKDYVLVLLFMKYVSDRYAGQPDAVIEVPEGGSFADMVALKGDTEIGDKINKIIARLAEKNDLKGIIDVADFNDPDKLGNGKEMVDRLSKLVSIFSKSELDFRKNRAEGDDILGDAYEYLMRHFATESGKSKGQFYTPAEVSRVMAKVIGIGSAKLAEQSIYDPTCGSGSLLLKAHDEALPVDLTIYGQEMDNATRALAKMNMILHGCPSADIWRGNTLADPHFVKDDGTLETHDFVVANPPFSNKAWTTGLDPAHDHFKRFAYGIPPAKNGDFAFLLHVLASLKSTGKGAIILPHGVLFRGNAEAEIRENLIRKGYIKGIIGLPPNLFFGTGIPACIIVVDKEHAKARTGIFMIDASKGFVKDGNKNRLRDQDVHKIVDVFTRLDESDPKYARMVPFAEIEGHEYNLNIPRYIDSSEAEDLQDIEAHLKGGIPNRDIDALAPYWAVMPGLRAELFAADRDGYSVAKLPAVQIKAAIHDHPQFQSFAAQVAEAFAGWRQAQVEGLKGLEVGCKPKSLIHTLAEDLLTRFAQVPLLDKYDVYQHLMTYWAEVMQDDVYVLSEDGWAAARDVRELVKNSEGKFSETPDITLGKRKLKADLIPPPLIVARFFAAEQSTLEQLELAAEEATQAKDEFEEEHGGEDGLLADARSDTDKLNAASVKARLKAIKTDRDADDERKVLKQWLDLAERESAANKAAKDSRLALDTKTVAKYATLTDAEIKALVVDDKWLAALDKDVQTELDRVSRALTSRIQLLEERYAVPLPALVERVADLTEKVDAHLKQMGFAWN